MSNRRRLQKILEAVVGAVSLYASQFLTLFFFYFGIKRISGYDPEKWIEYFILLTASYTILFLCFSSPINLLKRSRPMEFISTVRNCAMTYALFAVCLFFSKIILSTRDICLFLDSFFILFFRLQAAMY